MSDPAIEAAKGAIPVPLPSWMLDDKIIDGLSGYGIDAAREALKPIRELHQRCEDLDCGVICTECHYRWPCATAKLIYSSEELN